MILVDTSVWIDHLRRGNERLALLLDEGRVLGHPFVVGELACGNLHRRDEILTLLKRLPRATAASDDEVLRFVEAEALFGRGFGWIDAHLLAAARLSGCGLWTRDRSLGRAADALGLTQ